MKIKIVIIAIVSVLFPTLTFAGLTVSGSSLGKIDQSVCGSTTSITLYGTEESRPYSTTRISGGQAIRALDYNNKVEYYSKGNKVYIPGSSWQDVSTYFPDTSNYYSAFNGGSTGIKLNLANLIPSDRDKAIGQIKYTQYTRSLVTGYLPGTETKTLGQWVGTPVGFKVRSCDMANDDFNECYTVKMGDSSALFKTTTAPIVKTTCLLIKPQWCGDNFTQTNKGEVCDGQEHCKNDCSGYKTYCGDGTTQSMNDYGQNEQCDGGVNCNSDCTLKTYCGDEVTQAPNDYGQNEQCDGGTNCNSDCTLKSSCGDGIIQKPNGYGEMEVCDGQEHCKGDCSGYKTYCGDDTTQSMNDYGQNEQCDGGTNCNSDCTLKPYCGDGNTDKPNYLGFNEQCDGGTNCNADCTLKSYCGDGIIQNPNGYGEMEVCDGQEHCKNDCSGYKTYCGDGTTQSMNDYGQNEQCDGGTNCNANCTLKTYCGDDITQSPNDNGENEQCDGGTYCTSSCESIPRNQCGNGIVEVSNGEECDGTANCTSNCKIKSEPVCGDDVVNQSWEKCDGGTYCTSNCELIPQNQCGNGILEPSNGEECDGTANCTSNCKIKSEPVCGDDVVNQSWEQCDGGNDCTANCKIKTYCGDGIVQAMNDDGISEKCDNDSAYCTSTCQLIPTNVCGNGILELANGEECDGTANCNLNCKIDSGNPHCGDDVVDVTEGEECDGGQYCNNICEFDPYCGDNIIQKPNINGINEECDGGDYCNSQCQNLPQNECGNGIVESPEECDGTAGCNLNCKLDPGNPSCGNGVVEAAEGEECDGGTYCTPTCELIPQNKCGNGILEPSNGEECDGTANCNLNCKLDPGNPSCGNGIVEPVEGEECDGTTHCSNTCENQTYCGDTVIQSPNDEGINEACDGGDYCNSQCQSIPQSQCGNGILEPSNGEECDGTAGCNLNCKLDPGNPSCGNGVVEAAEGEECDGGINCSSTCEIQPYCGDGVANYDLGEQCDGTPNCRSNCKFKGGTTSYCGDGVVDPWEECDSELGCSILCVKTYCGDGKVDEPNYLGVIEQCDGGSNCNSQCKFTGGTTGPSCGNGVVDEGEECDGGSKCRADCTDIPPPRVIPVPLPPPGVTPPPPVCGNGIRESGEECDGSIGCNAHCRILYCGDGILSDMNIHGNKEECDAIDKVWCNHECKILYDKIPDGELEIFPTGNITLGFGERVFDKAKKPEQIKIVNRTGHPLNIDKNLCIIEDTYHGESNKLDVSYAQCFMVNKLSGNESKPFYVVDYMAEKLEGVDLQERIGKTKLRTYLNGTSKEKIFYVNIIAPSAMNIGGGTVFGRFNEYLTNIHNIAEELDYITGGDVAKNNNFVSTHFGSEEFSSHVETDDNSVKRDKAEEVYERDLEHLPSPGDTEISKNIDSMLKYKGLSRVYYYSGNIDIDSFTSSIAHNKTYLIGGDLNITSNVNFSEELGQTLFYVLGDIYIANDVTELDGIYVSKAGNIIGDSSYTTNQLTINGALYGESQNLLEYRTRITEVDKVIKTGTVVNFTSSIYINPPPLFGEIMSGKIQIEKFPKTGF